MYVFHHFRELINFSRGTWVVGSARRKLKGEKLVLRFSLNHSVNTNITGLSEDQFIHFIGKNERSKQHA